MRGLDEKLCPSVLPEGAQENKEAVACRKDLAASWMILWVLNKIR